MDIYEKAAYYTSMMERVQPELSRVERASRVLAVLEMECKSVSQRVGESVHHGAVPIGRAGGSESVSHESPDKQAAFRAFVKQHPDMTTREIAGALGMSQSTVSRWKRGMTRTASIQRKTF